MPDSEETKTEVSAETAVAAAPEPAAPVKVEAKAAKAPAKRRKTVKRVAKPKAAPKTKVATKRKPGPKPKPAAPVAKPKITPAFSSKPALAKTKEPIMKMSEKITGGVQTIMTDAQSKAKEAFEKSSAFFGDYADFAKGNVEAVVESGKILAEGLQDMGTSLIAESRSAFESASADIKDMAAAKSPTDLLQVQGEMVRKNFDTAVAYGSKNTEAVLKLASEVMAPISSRVSLAVEKVRQTAI